MPRDPLPDLTGPELEVLKRLWSEGRLSARQLHERLQPESGWAYSTTRTTLERMVDKGLLARQAFHGINLYQPAISRPRGLAARVREFAERVLERDPAPVVSLLAESGVLDRDEVKELRRLIDEGAGKRPGRKRR